MTVADGLRLAGLLLVVGSWIWLILQIMRSSPPLALLATLIPFMTWWFAVQNWDLAWKPILCKTFGFGLILAGALLDG